MNDFALMHEVTGRARGRVDVLGAPLRRRSYSRAEKARLVAETLEPGTRTAAVQQFGSVLILGTDIARLSGPARDRFRADHVGFIFQQFNLVPYLGLIENVVLPCRFSAARQKRAIDRSGTAEAEARRLLAGMNLDVAALAGRPVSTLSVGQQQRVAAARSLIGVPELVIADEPTSSIDEDARRAFLSLLFDELERAGATLLFVSHERSLEPLFGRVVALADINRAAGGA